MDVGRYIAGLREARGWSQTELARRAKTGRTYINALEQQAKAPTAPMLGRILLALHEGRADFEVVEAFEAAGYSHQQAVLALDTLTQNRPPPADEVSVIESALKDGGWAEETRRALLHLVRVTRPEHGW